MAFQPTQDTSPLNEYELDLAGEIAGVIWADSAVFTNGFGVAVTLTQLALLKTKLRSFCSALDASACGAVRDALAIWISVRLGAFAIDAGSIGNCISNVSISSDSLRQQAMRIFQIYVPVMTLAQGAQKRDDAVSGPAYLRVG